MNTGMRIVKGSVVGREHMRTWRNNQDAMQSGELSINKRQYLYGVVADGCSEGRHSEVGAKLLAEWINRELPMILSTGVSTEDAVQTLYRRAIDYLTGIVRTTVVGTSEQMVEFVRNYLLCTIVGFVVDEQECYIFSAGDGLVVINDEMIRIDQDNKPIYLGYHVIPRSCLQDAGELPTGFKVMRIKTEMLQRLMISTDGMEEDAVERLWNKESDVQLTRELKRLSRVEGRLADDCTVIVVERLHSI